MRSLMLTIIFISFNGKAKAAPSEFNLSYFSNETLQLNELNVPQSGQSIGIKNSLNSNINLSLVLNQLKQDLSNRNIILKNSQQIPLSQLDNGEKQTLDTQINFNYGKQSSTLIANQDIKKSLFTSKSFGYNHSSQFYSGATQFIFKSLYTTQNQPLSYYIDPNTFESKERRTSVSTISLIIGIEQLWTENYKSLSEVEFKKSYNFRPETTVLKYSQAYAFTDTVTFKSQLGLALENRGEILYDDRGYFNSRWIDIDFVYEWNLDSFVTFGLSALDEIEVDPRRQRQVGLGTDSLALEIKQNLKSLSYNIGFSYFLNSEKQTATGYKGALTWNF